MNSFYSSFEYEYPLYGTNTGPGAVIPHGWSRSSVLKPLAEPCDEEFMKKVQQHQRIMQEIDSQWNLPIPWSNSIGVDPKIIFGLARSAPSADDDLENRTPQPKRRKTKVSDNDNDDMDAAFPPVAYPVSSSAPLPAPTSKKTASQKPRAKRPRTAPEKPPHASTSAKNTEPEENTDEDDGPIAGLRHVRCRWGGCNQVIERVSWQEHMDDAHRLRMQGRGHAKWLCQWAGCRGEAATHPSMVRHLRTGHFVGKVHMCDSCGDVFSRRDSRNRHVDTRTCLKPARAARR